ncbi:hypothetical protein L6452_44475 [Arctium lappa]|uniref:Uncharacterized protein n=1 Tax=Arctium lappa TaxID=4217 RepID=A0ACB8XFS5_ARCLA|nr:hypothetical protein L6452_44475 [Arctium lappa]
MKSDNEKSKDGEKSKEGKVRKDNDGKAESKGKKVKEKKKDEEPPRHPGLLLQTKENNDSKLRSLSLSLDSLLGYDDNDIEESTFELSLFAETIYEMLQYQMGSRILTFLQKLRIKFVAKRNENKRRLEEISEKEKEKVKTSTKRVKTDNATVESKSVETEPLVEALKKDEKTIAKVENMLTKNVENTKLEGEDPEEDPEENPEEDPEEDEDMTDASPKDDTENEAILQSSILFFLCTLPLYLIS